MSNTEAGRGQWARGSRRRVLLEAARGGSGAESGGRDGVEPPLFLRRWGLLSKSPASGFRRCREASAGRAGRLQAAGQTQSRGLRAAEGRAGLAHPLLALLLMRFWSPVPRRWWDSWVPAGTEAKGGGEKGPGVAQHSHGQQQTQVNPATYSLSSPEAPGSQETLSPLHPSAVVPPSTRPCTTRAYQLCICSGYLPLFASPQSPCCPLLLSPALSSVPSQPASQFLLSFPASSGACWFQSLGVHTGPGGVSILIPAPGLQSKLWTPPFSPCLGLEGGGLKVGKVQKKSRKPGGNPGRDIRQVLWELLRCLGLGWSSNTMLHSPAAFPTSSYLDPAPELRSGAATKLSSERANKPAEQKGQPAFVWDCLPWPSSLSLDPRDQPA